MWSIHLIFAQIFGSLLIFILIFLQVLTGLGTQITSLWSKEELIPPNQLAKFLKTLFHLTQHPSLTIANGAACIWASLLKHDQISKEAVFLEYIPKIIEAFGPKVIKVRDHFQFGYG